MKQAAIGISVHSGWGALVAIGGSPQALELLDRRRVVITDPAQPGAKQPYHFAQTQPLMDAKRHIAECAAASEQLALAGLEQTIDDLRGRRIRLAGCAVLLASGRQLPDLAAILQSHSLIHTAEGQFFRRAFWKASERLGIPVVGYRQRELEREFRSACGAAAGVLFESVATLGKVFGPPWTADQKNASLAALLLLHRLSAS